VPRASPFLRAQSALHVFIYRRTRGRLGRTLYGVPILILSHVGRRSGKQLDTPLMFTRDGEDFVLIASNGGRPWHPAWYLNLAAHPDAWVELAGRRYRVQAVEVPPGQEKERLWRKMARLYPRYDDYQRRTDRTIPLVRLRPVASAR